MAMDAEFRARGWAEFRWITQRVRDNNERLNMVADIPTGTLAHGSMFMCIGWHDEPVGSQPALICELPLADGSLAFLVLENRLLVEIVRLDETKDELTDQWITPELIHVQGAPVVVTLVWADGKLVTFRLNQEDVPRSEGADVFEIRHSKNVVKAAKETFSSPQKWIDHRRGSARMSLAFKQLSQWRNRLETHLRNQRTDTPELVFEIANCLRTLLCGTKKNGGLLLFRCAEEMGVNLVCYTVYPLKDEPRFPLMDETTIVFGTLPVASPYGKAIVETDLGCWLDTPALITGDNEPQLPHWKLIREVADNFGSHATTDHASIGFSFMNPHRPELNLGMLETCFREYGRFALEITTKLLEANAVLRSETKP